MPNELNLHEISINKLFITGEKCTYQVPIYQRNYAWEKDEIEALVNDVWDAFKKDCNSSYYIGTLVSFRREDNVYEVIDGQQRLTTIRILLQELGKDIQNNLTYRARTKSTKTLEHLDHLSKVEEKDKGIENGLKYVNEVLKDKKNDKGFVNYFLNNVHIIHYIVPRDIDLNHYFEVMNSRGEQLEKHEIVKARLMQKLSDEKSRRVFNKIWEACCQMSVYIQDSLDFGKKEGRETNEAKEKLFGADLNDFTQNFFEDVVGLYSEENSVGNKISINKILTDNTAPQPKEKEKSDSFQPIIDFPNFLLIVLKITRLMNEDSFDIQSFTLDDKELINQFNENKQNHDVQWVKTFAYNLLKAKFFLDNYIVHHAEENETEKSNPWELKTYTKGDNKRYLKNLCGDDNTQNKLVQLLSMFEVSFTARQRKNYLFYCLYWLMNNDFNQIGKYAEFVENLASTYFNKIYMNAELLNEINTPRPDSFDKTILIGKNFQIVSSEIFNKKAENFEKIYGNGSAVSKGIPLFIFNYLDYKIWKLYDENLRGEKLKEGSSERTLFFKEKLGCSDFGLDIFKNFYFSRTRRSLEHYYPQSHVQKLGKLSEAQINCLGNYAMIGSEANSSGSDWEPDTKIQHYKDKSGKINKISVASLKFWIMMQICKDNKKWDFEEIKLHQEQMLRILA